MTSIFFFHLHHESIYFAIIAHNLILSLILSLQFLLKVKKIQISRYLNFPADQKKTVLLYSVCLLSIFPLLTQTIARHAIIIRKSKQKMNYPQGPVVCKYVCDLDYKLYFKTLKCYLLETIIIITIWSSISKIFVYPNMD